MSETQKITIKDLSFLDELATTDQVKLSGGQDSIGIPVSSTFPVEIETACGDIIQLPSGDVIVGGDIIVESVCSNDPPVVNVIP